MSRSTTTGLLSLVVLSSGAAALVYESIWTRAFAIIMGSTVEATAAVFAAFLGGLALGAWSGGQVVRKIDRLVGAYILLELGIAAVGTAVGLLLFAYRNELPVLAGAPGDTFRVVRTLGLTLGLVLLPTVLMGATFPFVLDLARRLSLPRTEIGKIYAFNTLGGAAGALVCGFFLIRLLGVRWSCAAAAALNVLAATLLLVMTIGRKPTPTSRDAAWDPEAKLPLAGMPSEGLLLGVAVLSGAAVLALEVVWARFASYFLGNRVHAVTTLLAWVLVLLALGSALSSRLLVRFGHNVGRLLAWLLALCAAGALVSTGGAVWWVRVQPAVEAMLTHAPGALIGVKILATGLLLCPMLIPLGCLFPLVLTASRHSGQSVGRTAGRFYLWNTVGSVVGSLGTGFLLIPLVGVLGSSMVVIAGIGLCAGGLGVARNQGGGLRWRRGPLLTVAAVLVAVPLLLPQQLVVIRPGDELVFRKEDEHGILQITRTPSGWLRTTNNRTELVFLLGNPRTSYVQQMQAHLPMFYRPDAGRVLVLGSGYGITAGAFGVYPDVLVDAVEIVPGLVEAADFFEPFNLGYHKNPRVQIVVDDARHFLSRRSGKDVYDIVSVNVSDPLMQGQGSLFSADFYRLVKHHMAPDGVFVQHVFGTHAGTIFATLSRAFTHVHLYRSYGNGYNVVAANEPLHLDEARVARLTTHEPVRKALEGIGVSFPISPARTYAQAIDLEAVRPLMEGAEICTDDQPVLEYTLGDARNMLFTNQ